VQKGAEISIKEIAAMLNPGRPGRRYLALLKFYCDESYDSDPSQSGMAFYDVDGQHVPKAYVVGGFIANERIWENIGERWRKENERVGVSRYHGAYVNARSGEFAEWSKDQQREYSQNLIEILRDQKRDIHAISCGMFPREYEQIINAMGREKLGHPYIACFKSCIAMIAQELDIRGYAPDDKFAVILDRNDLEGEAVEVFYKMKDSEIWPFHHRLATCAPGNWQEHIELQPADLIAYESFRILGEKYNGREGIRPALRSMFKTNGFLGYYFESDTFKKLKADGLESCDCVPNGFVVNFPPPPEEP
jgi:hypothetical protein